MHRDPRGMMPKASRQFSKGVWIHPELKFKCRLLFHKTQTVPPSQTLHELTELKIYDFYASVLNIPCPLLNLQPVFLGRTHKPRSQPNKATLFLLKGVSSFATEPAKHGFVCSCVSAIFYQMGERVSRRDSADSVFLRFLVGPKFSTDEGWLITKLRVFLSISAEAACWMMQTK